MTEFTKQLLTKQEAAELLGVSLSTFDRARKRLGLRPATTFRSKPVVFVRADVLRFAGNGVTISADAPLRTAIPTMRQLRAERTKAGRGKR